MSWLGIALAGALGAIARWGLDRLVMSRLLPWSSFPVGTLLINLTGSLGLGLVSGLALHAVVSAATLEVVGGGFLGAYTTFSTLALESTYLWRRGARLAAVGNALGTVAGGTVLAGFGLWVGTSLS